MKDSNIYRYCLRFLFIFTFVYICVVLWFSNNSISPFINNIFMYIYIDRTEKKYFKISQSNKKKECLPLTSLMRRCLWIFHFLLSFHNNRKEQQQTQIRTHIHFGGRNQSSFNLYLFRFAIAFCTHSCSDFLERWK